MVVRPSVGSQSCGGVTQDEWMLLQEEEIPLWGLERDTRHARGRGGWTDAVGAAATVDRIGDRPFQTKGLFKRN